LLERFHVVGEIGVLIALGERCSIVRVFHVIIPLVALRLLRAGRPGPIWAVGVIAVVAPAPYCFSSDDFSSDLLAGAVAVGSFDQPTRSVRSAIPVAATDTKFSNDPGTTSDPLPYAAHVEHTRLEAFVSDLAIAFWDC
jgi:hypothetical protein